MMKLFIAILALMLLSGPVLAADGDARFFETLYDVPVMPGLSELPEKALVFDKPSGRIAQAGAAGNKVSGQDIRAFYAASLPQLGWAPAGPDMYAREGEKLVLSVAYEAGYSTVRFTLSPVH
jgi:hypothetical protein